MKVNAQILIVMLLLSLMNVNAQTYFNNRYDGSGSCDLTANIDTIANKYVTAGIECTPISYFSLNMSSFYYNGTLCRKKTYAWLNNNIEASKVKWINKNRVYACGIRVPLGYRSKTFMWRFNSELDSVDYKEYGFANQINWAYNFIINKYDNNIYMTGLVDDTLYTNRDILLIKTDTAGNEIWKKKIGIVGLDETAVTIDTLQGELIIGGYKTTHGTYNTAGFVMRLDTAGNVIWNKTVNTNFGSGSGAKTLKDGNVLVYSGYRQYSIGTDDYLRMQVEKITPNNVTLWNKHYNAPQMYAGASIAIENTRGNIVIASQTGFFSNMINGKVNEIAQNGDSLFTKEYAIMPGSQNYFRDVMQTTDGGYCFAGFVIPLPEYSGTGTEDIWLLKVDSNFCESSAPCGYGVGLIEQEILNGGIRLYPNPASSVINIEFSSLDFARDDKPKLTEPITIQITNTLGQVLISKTYTTSQITQNNGIITLSPLEELEGTGMYYLSVKTKDKTRTQKIIIKK